jgi:hypothetical protein
MKRVAVTSLLVLLGVLLIWGEASAQAGPPPGPGTVWGQRNLSFGTVIAGMPTTVSWNSSSGGRWYIFGQGGAEVQLDFINLPSTLRNGARQLPVSFSSTDAAYSRSLWGGGAVAFDPNVGTTVRLPNGLGILVVYIGGSANPPPNQQPGTYVADIDLDVYYTGN